MDTVKFKIGICILGDSFLGKSIIIKEAARLIGARVLRISPNIFTKNQLLGDLNSETMEF